MKSSRHIVIVAHNLRSSLNIGSLLRTADGLGATVYLTGYTPYPKSETDERLPHLANKIHAQIRKTALGAEESTNWRHVDSIKMVITDLKANGFVIAALEQTANSLPLPTYEPPDKIVLILGREVEGIEPEILEITDVCLEIPMSGRKESFNVTQAAAMALYHCRFFTNFKQQ